MGGSPSINKVVVHAPATSANLGSGFDSLGIALELRDEVSFQVAPDGQWRAAAFAPDGSPSPEPTPTGRSNLTIRGFEAAFREVGQEAPPVHVVTVSRIPVARGLGSSAAATVAGVMAANAYLGGVLDLQTRLNIAAKIEGHPDNTAACTLGGMTASSLVGSGVLWAGIPLHTALSAVVAIPDFQVSTVAARNVLPMSVQHADAVFNVTRAALLVASLASGAYGNLRYAMEDKLHQPYRAPLVPGLLGAVKAACDAGALGAYMSGAGPSILALVPADADPAPAARAMHDAFAMAHVAASTVFLPISPVGATMEVE